MMSTRSFLHVFTVVVVSMATNLAFSQNDSTSSVKSRHFERFYGGYTGYSTFGAPVLGGSFEFRPRNTLFSLNVDPGVILVLPVLPVYIKFIVGNKFRVCPAIGVFTRIILLGGVMAGLHLEYLLKDQFLIFLKNEYYRDHIPQTGYFQQGGSYSYTNIQSTLQFSIGLKIRAKEKSK